MYKQVLKVHGEDLFEGGEAKKVIANGTEGALEVVAVAVEDGTYSDTVTVTHSDTKTGEFTQVASASVAGTVAKGEVIGRVALPSDVKRWVSASCSNANIRITLNYLAR